MIIYVDGPEKAGKTSLIREAAEGFEESRHEIVKQTGKDPRGGMGYIRSFLSHIDSMNVYLWDRGWVSEVVYGQLLDDGRPFGDDPFLCEWFYGRPLLGRGGRFVLVPYDTTVLFNLRDGTDLPVSPIAETNTYSWHGEKYGYQELVNHYDTDSMHNNILTLRRSGLVHLHRVDSTAYIGPRRPFFTFIGEPVKYVNATNTIPRPFYSAKVADYFRSYDELAITEFGYSSIAAYEQFSQDYPELWRRPITVGKLASAIFPDLPNVPMAKGRATVQRVADFEDGVAEIMRQYNKEANRV